MVKITSTVIVHRPERVLYYLPEISDEVNQCISDGVCPSLLAEYRYAFGTYDDVGAFYLSPALQKETGMNWIVGLEYRKDDPTLNVPEQFPFVVLPECDVMIQDVSYEGQLTEETLREIMRYGRECKDDRSAEYRYVQDGLMAAFTSKEKLRVLYEIELLEENSLYLNRMGHDYTKEELSYKAFHDPITGYYNWSWMWDRLASYYLDGITDYGFVHFDIKDFNMINEIYNHQVANDVLTRVTRNIEAHKDWIYFGARCDNDNFALMIKGMPEDVVKEKLIDFFEEISVLEEDPSYRIFYRCGVVNMRNALNTGAIVADCAKMAQAAGVKTNVTEINFYTNEMHENLLWGKHLKAYLDTAIQEDEFLVFLQPKIDVHTERIYGAEALVRWNYKHRKMLTPYHFISQLESDDSIIKVDNQVLHKVCEKLKDWKEKGLTLYPVSVNLSRKHMELFGLAEHLTEIVDVYGVDHSLIEFELTETLDYHNQRYLISVMEELKAKGFLISMDDFGTGYSSFALLKEMPLDTLKIDKSFVDLLAAESPEKIRIILRHIISMAKELGMHCVAEGAEEYMQVQALEELGCDAIQGYYYSRPIPMEEYEEKYL